MKRIVCVMCMLMMLCIPNFGGIYFENTKEDTKRDDYSPDKVKGKKVATLRLSKGSVTNDTNEQIYPIFVTHSDVTYVNFEKYVAEVIKGESASKLTVDFDEQGRQKGFSIRSTEGPVIPKTIQIILAGGSKVYLKVYSVSEAEANSVVNFLNYKESDEGKTKDNSEALQDELKLRTALISTAFTDGVLLYPLNLKKQIKTSSLELQNLNVINNTYYFNLLFTGTDLIRVDFNAIELEVRDLKKSFLSAKKNTQVSFPVKDVIVKNISDNQQVVILEFQLPQRYTYFDFRLWVAPKTMFDSKVSLDLIGTGLGADPMNGSVL